MRNGSKRVLGAGILAGLAYAAGERGRRGSRSASRDDHVGDRTVPVPADPAPVAPTRRSERRRRAARPRADRRLEPGADGACPVTHPVKAKLSSGIYHVPGGGNYERTKPDRCYVDAAAAEADGLRAAKR